MAVSAILLLHCWAKYQCHNLTEVTQQVYLLLLQVELGVAPPLGCLVSVDDYSEVEAAT
ncbi:hypothetical protein DPMN_177588 [Dreissena polymorpha]|uniref:Uncharacterized protein n=1 Tax=Dreissena polymorpha TaxID=45954 RepID=A0A9D4E9A3_DREPO|nr:hypothetical protein DPMN_177588 [Dreissena polymorpha]